MTMFNISPWGGLHENIWYSCLGLKDTGWDVTVACRAGRLVDKLMADGISVHVIDDWTNWHDDANTLGRRDWAIIHSHPFASRELALSVKDMTGAPLVSTFHGNNLDDVMSWSNKVDAFVAVSPAHADMLIQRAGIAADRIVVVPNGVWDSLISQRPRTWTEKADQGQARVVVASRLDPDKLGLLHCVEQIVCHSTRRHRPRVDHPSFGRGQKQHPNYGFPEEPR